MNFFRSNPTHPLSFKYEFPRTLSIIILRTILICFNPIKSKKDLGCFFNLLSKESYDQK